MLQSACCQNYLCIHCANDVKEREKKNENFYAECPYKCNSAGVGAETAGVRAKFILTDVDEDAKVKRYSDSQCMSFFSNNLGAIGAQSNNAAGGGQAVFNGRGTVSSAGKSFAGASFKWNTNNKALEPALIDKENLEHINRSQEDSDGNQNNMGMIAIRSLLVEARGGGHTLSDYGQRQYNKQ